MPGSRRFWDRVTHAPWSSSESASQPVGLSLARFSARYLPGLATAHGLVARIRQPFLDSIEFGAHLRQVVLALRQLILERRDLFVARLARQDDGIRRRCRLPGCD